MTDEYYMRQALIEARQAADAATLQRMPRCKLSRQLPKRWAVNILLTVHFMLLLNLA